MFRTTLSRHTTRPTLYIPGSTNGRLPACPPGIGTYPHLWTREDVKIWINWCMEEFALEGIDLDKFSMNGKALCMLNKPDFNDRAKNGDVLYNTLQQLLSTNKSSPGVCMASTQSSLYHPGLHSPHHDRFQYGVMTPASPHDLLLESPLVATSPPSYNPSSQKPANVYRMMSRQSSQILSRSPSPCFESPLDLSRDRDHEGSVSGDETGGGASEDLRGTHRLSVPTTPVGRITPTHPNSRSPRSHSPDSRSPVRRPSPSGESLSPVPVKMQRMDSVESGHVERKSSAIYANNYLPTPAINRDPSPEHFHGLRHKFALTRLDSKEGHLDGRGRFEGPRHGEGQRDGGPRHLSDATSAQEEGDCSEGSMQSESENLTEDCGNGNVKPIHIVPTNPNAVDSDVRMFPSQIPLTVNNVETADDCYDPDAAEGDIQGDTKLLWEFIYQLLRSPEYSSLVRWEDEVRLVFRIINPSELARLWGLQKSRGNMTYEKLSRALRYYYKMNIIVKEPHRRLTYRFVKPPESIQRGQKGAKPGVSHKRRVSPSPTTSPSCSPTSTSPLSCSPSSSSPTQVPVISLTTPQSQVSLENTTVIQDNEATTTTTSTSTPLVPSPKPYSPITARAYYNLCRQYSMDNARGLSWCVPADSPAHAPSDSAENNSSERTVSTDNPNSMGDKERSQPTSPTFNNNNISLPFQSGSTEHGNNKNLQGSNVPVIETKKDDMIKQESLEFTVSERLEDTRELTASDSLDNNPQGNL